MDTMESESEPSGDEMELEGHPNRGRNSGTDVDQQELQQETENKSAKIPPPPEARPMERLASRQVIAFTSEEELQPLVDYLGVRKVALAEISPGLNLENAYVGGEVVADSRVDFSEGAIEMVICDDSMQSLDKHITCYLRGEITTLLPRDCLSNSKSKIYFNRVSVGRMFMEYSQDFERCINIQEDDREARIWIVHQNAYRDDFLPTDKSKFSKRRRKKAKALLLLRKAQEQNEKDSNARKRNTTSDLEREPGDSGNDPVSFEVPMQDAPGPSGVTIPPPPEQPSLQSFPDNFDIPDSALKDFHTQESSSDSSELLGVHSSSEEEEEEEEDTDDEWQPKRKKPKVGDTGRQYGYKKIAELQPGEKKVNVFGVVTEFKAPFPTRGRDYCSFVTIVDESSPTSGIKCTLFNHHQDKLPQVQQIGDIVCLHRVNVKEQNGAPCIDGVQFTSSLCFDGKPGSSMTPRTGSVTYTFTAHDNERVRNLRSWGLKHERQPFVRKLNSVTPGCHFDLICQVVAVTDCRPQCDAVTLTVWDGTKLPLKTRQIDFSQLNSRMSPQLQHIASVLLEHVAIYNDACIKAVSSFALGQLVSLQNLCAAVRRPAINGSQAMVELCLPGEGKVMVLPGNDPDFCELRAELEKAGGERAHIIRYSPITASAVTSVTTTSHQDIPITTIKRIQSCTTLPVKFKCRVKVMGIGPSTVEEMIQMRCPQCGLRSHTPHFAESHDVSDHVCPNCSGWHDTSQNQIQHCSLVFAFKLLLEDETGQIVAYISDRHAVDFLGGLQPSNLYHHQEMRYKVIDKLYYLTGGNDPFVGFSSTLPRPWAEFCLVSYHLNPPVGDSHQVCYRIFGTSLDYDKLPEH